MQRFAAWVVASMLLLTACGRPAGVDGDLTNDWPALRSVEPFVPRVGDCYEHGDAGLVVHLVSVSELEPCTSKRADHETVYVGRFSGVDADRDGPPAKGSPALRAAYERCLPFANEHLGGDWQGALVTFTLVLPTQESWRVGVRTFHCDLGHSLTMAGVAPFAGKGSVKDGLRGDRRLALPCAVDSGYGRLVDIGCDRPHHAEFAGVYTAPDVPWQDPPTALIRVVDAGCAEIVARYVGFPSARAWRNDQLGVRWTDAHGNGLDQPRWAIGDRAVRCFVSTLTPARWIVGSVQGIGSSRPRDA
jgi:hypothetical protein